MNNIRVLLNYRQWTMLSGLLRFCAEKAPMETVEVETCLLAEYYRRRIQTFTFFRASKKNKMAVTFQASEIFALHQLYAGRHPGYDELLRIDIEPILPPLRS